jgi:hypothetical protein
MKIRRSYGGRPILDWFCFPKGLNYRIPYGRQLNAKNIPCGLIMIFLPLSEVVLP